MSRKNHKKRFNLTRKNGSAADWTELRNLAVGVLEIDHGYQRPLNIGWAKWIASNFNPDVVNIIQVSYRDGHYYVIDGQHTITGIKLKFRDENYPVACKIYYGLDETEESKLFHDFNKQKKSISAADMLKSQAAYGDEEVRSFLDHTRDAGFIIEPGKRANCRYGIQAVKKAQTCFKTLGPEQYDRMLSLLKQTWNGEKWSVSQNMLGGMCLLLKVFGDHADDATFASQLGKVSERELLKEVSRFSDETVPVAYASAIVNLYNKGLRGKSKRLKRSMLLDD